MAFKMAAAIAFKKGMEEAKPVLDMNKRRGKILGMESNGKGKQILEALAPQGETFKYAIDLKSMTQGRGYFEMEFDSYAEVPASSAEKIIAAANA